MKRTFIAIKIEPGEELRKVIFNFRDTLRNDMIKWVEDDNIHLTLRFLGNTNPGQVATVTQLLKNICVQKIKFEFHLSGAGIFKSFRKPRVIWIGIEQDNGLQSLYRSINENIEDSGFTREPDLWLPHLTIGRIKEITSKKLLRELIDKYQNQLFQLVKVQEIVFFESKLFPSGPVYFPVEKFSLKIE